MQLIHKNLHSSVNFFHILQTFTLQLNIISLNIFICNSSKNISLQIFFPKFFKFSMLVSKWNSGHSSMSSRKTQRWWRHKSRAPRTCLTSRVHRPIPRCAERCFFPTVWSALLWNCCFLISCARDAAAVCWIDADGWVSVLAHQLCVCVCVYFTHSRILPTWPGTLRILIRTENMTK